MQAAEDYFQQAVKLDPSYADAWAGLAETYVKLSEISTLPLKEVLPKIRSAAQKALALDPHNVNALVALGNADVNDNRIAEAKAELKQALALDPSNAAAHDVYSDVLPIQQALAQSQEAARLDPDSAEVQVSLASYYQDLSNWPQMVAASLALNRLSPHGIDAAFYLAFAYAEMQRGEDAVKAFDLAQPSTALDRKLIEAGRLTYQTRLEPTLRPKALAALASLSHAKLSPFSQSGLIQLYLALGEKETAMSMLPGLCAAAPIACNDLAINPEFITPLHDDPHFEKLAKQYTTITRDPAPASTSPH
ncbi:MAG: tetratricopeptide repeat protein [Gammaproteobacteria bacterium]|nr:tetratricopeptide repeat protein [Gammaproteobacteria bacterium]MBU6509690.1 tetratricopeptide repeat protein [Gammaproteobacteria bacterium]MDE1983662.1 tetratricopeptide repeat protein [Gammaproteobacteria bacterium]